MKGFKATKNMKCNQLTYEVGKTYNITNIKICSHGFHFCKNQKDVLNYYDYDKDFVLLEIESLGEEITVDDKTVSDSIRIVRVIPKEEYEFEIPIEEYDSNNNMIHHKNSYGSEYWSEYDSNNNLIHHKNSDGYEEWREYDSNNNLIHYKDSYGSEYWKEYDSNNNLFHHKDSSGYEW